MKLDPQTIRSMKGIEPIAMLTAYTCPIARYLEKSDVPIILVGDTVGMVEMGFNSTCHVTMDHMQYHVAAVRRGATQTHIIGDLPYQSYESPESALHNARLLVEAGADSVKLEGPHIEEIEHLVANDVAVVGHTGLTPQTALNFKQVGKEAADAKRIVDEAHRIAAAGAFLLVIEHVPSTLGQAITDSIEIPTVGIGAGPACDGQVLVVNDALGIGDYWPPFSRQYAQAGEIIQQAVARFKAEVVNREFP